MPRFRYICKTVPDSALGSELCSRFPFTSYDLHGNIGSCVRAKPMPNHRAPTGKDVV